MRKFTLYIIIQFLLFIAYKNAYAASDTLKLYFDLDKYELENTSKYLLDSLAYTDALNHNDKITIVGYADYLGDTAYNIKLSQQRANKVQTHLLLLGIDKKNITICIGKGEVQRNMTGDEGYAPDRRVDVVWERQRLTIIPKSPASPIITVVNTAKPPEVKVVPVSPPFEGTKLEVGRTYSMDRMYFYSGRHTVMDESKPELHRLYQTLVDNPTLQIRIEGHVCCVADTVDALDEQTLEQSLSVNRAKYIYYYLINRGIDADRLSYAGFGRTRPLIKHELSAEDAEKNRRVEIRILDK